jgi:tRNA(Arg) A34 adenosine deaminase TadA
MNDNDKKIILNEQRMKEACDLALYSVWTGGGPFGCIITDSSLNIISNGHNMVTINNDPTQHAEIVAIRNACKKRNDFQLEDCILFTSCEPCPMCLSAIYWARIKKVYYGNTRKDAKEIGFDDDFIYNEIGLKNVDKSIVIEQCNENYAKEAFLNWSKKENKIKY